MQETAPSDGGISKYKRSQRSSFFGPKAGRFAEAVFDFCFKYDVAAPGRLVIFWENIGAPARSDDTQAGFPETQHSC
jgi:hypothetical protein